ncbi:MAG: class I SAM-dependent methyltransferase [Streptosporangiales bacterium]
MTSRDYRVVQAASFNAAAAEYERGRPPYPAQALDWLLPPGVRRVLDLGAGTGKLTRQLLDRGIDVVAVEPSEEMRHQLTQVLPHVSVLPGTAEEVPLPDDAVDTVLVAQAWHWVDVDRAVPEVARVLSAGGQLGLMWNIRDERTDWVRRLERIMHRGTEQEMNGDSPLVGPPFGPIERRDIEWTHQLTRESLLDLVASRSYIITLSPAERATVLAGVHNLLQAHPALCANEYISMPYLTQCSRARLSPRTSGS